MVLFTCAWFMFDRMRISHENECMHLQEYMKLLEDSFNPVAGEKLMCRDTVSVAWDGSLCVAASFLH